MARIYIQALRKLNLLSRHIGFNDIELVYVFMVIKDVFGISLQEINWEVENLFTFKCLCNLVEQNT